MALLPDLSQLTQISRDTKPIDVTSVCNALVDILIKVEDKDIEALKLTKGIMHLVDPDRQEHVLKHFAGREQVVELGGSAMNCIRTLAALGHRTTFAGMVADDSFGKEIRRRLNSLAIESHLGTHHVATGSCVILVTPDAERTMNTCLGASRLYDEEHVPVTAIRKSRILHVSGYQWDTDGQKKAIMKALHVAKDSGCLVSFDLADPFVVGHHREDFWRVIEDYADFVFANKEEARLLSQQDDPKKACELVNAKGAIAIIKIGAEGAYVRGGEELIHVPAQATQVVDTTAAGDMFAAGFLHGLCKGYGLAECGKLATKLAADVISRVGARLSDQVLAELR